MRRYKIYHAPIMSFFSMDFYKDVATHWKGAGFFFLLVLLAVCWISFLVTFQTSFIHDLRDKAPAIIAQIPEIRIVNGEASVDVAQPYKIINPQDGSVLALIDTTGKTTSLEEQETWVLLTKSAVIMKKNDIETKSFSLETVENFTLNRGIVNRWLNWFCKYSAVVFYFFAVAGSFVYRIAQMLIYAAIGLLFAKLCNTRISYQALLRLSVMAVTPVIIVGTILQTAGIRFPFQNLLYFIAAMIYLFLGVKAVSDSEKEPIHQSISP